jgi:hypothetical protein
MWIYAPIKREDTALVFLAGVHRKQPSFEFQIHFRDSGVRKHLRLLEASYFNTQSAPILSTRILKLTIGWPQSSKP